MKLDPLLNRRVIFKLHGKEPLDSTIIKKDEGGYWIRGGTLLSHLNDSNCSLPENDVRYLEYGRIEWMRALRNRS